MISDGRIAQTREEVAKWTLEAAQKRQLLVMIVVDHQDPSKSILKLPSVTYVNSKYMS